MSASCPYNLLLAVMDLRGGTGTFCRNLAGALKSTFPDRWRVSILLMRGLGMLESDRSLFHEIKLLDLHIGSGWRRALMLPLHVRPIRAAVERISPDIVVTVGTHANLLVSSAAGERPVVLTEHLYQSRHLSGMPQGRWLRFLMRRRYRNAAIVAPSRGVAEDLRDHIGAKDVHVIPHGLDIDRIRSCAEESPGTRVPEQFVVFCGRLSKDKDLPTLLRAFAKARKAGLTIPLVIAGEGELQAEVENLIAELKLRDAVHLLGHMENPFPIISRAKMFVLSSVREAFGFSLVEAMALGIPCVATDCPTGPAEILENGRDGLLVPPQQPDALADAIVRVDRDGALRENLAQAGARRAQAFALEPFAREYDRLLSTQLGTNR